MSTIVFPQEMRSAGIDGEGLPSVRFSPMKKDLNFGFDAVQLYLPSGLQFTDSANYAGLELGTISAAKNVINQVSSGNTNEIISRDETLVAGLKVLDKLGADQNTVAATAFSRGVAFNPQTALAFESMNLRSFTFSFTLVPERAEDSERIHVIESYFRKYMYPELEGFVSKYPPIFRIQFFDGGSDTESVYMPMIYDAYLANLDVVINPEGNSFHKTDWGYAPTSTQMTLTFQEGRMLSRQDLYKDVSGKNVTQNYARPEGPRLDVSPTGEGGEG